MAQLQQRNQLILLAVLLGVAALVWYFGVGKVKSSADLASAVKNYAPINAQDYSTVLTKLHRAETTEYKTTGRNIFVASAEPVAEVQKTEAPKYANQGPQLPPPPPPAQLPMKFFGYGTVPTTSARRAFLLDGEDVHIVEEGETVLNHIRITHIGNDRIDFVDTTTGQIGSNALEANPSPS